MAELLVVIGVMTLLMALVLAPLRSAHRQALSTRCKVQLQQIGLALEHALNESGFYPLWDDGGSPSRYTFIDVLVEREMLGNVNVAYCPEDPKPSSLNSDRGRHFNVYYPGRSNVPGIDYSYGIGVPLSSGGTKWTPNYPLDGDPPGRSRRFENHDRNTAQRLLVADASWSCVYNVSGDALTNFDWSYPTQYDNTVAWRHANNTANVLYQDGHVNRLRYRFDAAQPVNTSRTCLWFPGESVHVGPSSMIAGNFYPCAPPVNFSNPGSDGMIPLEMVPSYYTRNLLWTRIYHK